MSESDQRTFRLYLLLSTALVMLGGAGGFLVWWTSHPSQTGRAAEDAAADEGALRPVDFLARTTPDERERITRLVDQAVLENPDPARGSPADDELVSMGVLAAPRLVDALHRLSLGEGYRLDPNRAKAGAADRLLVRIRQAIPNAPYPAMRERGDDHVRARERRARDWLRWWETMQERGLAGN